MEQAGDLTAWIKSFVKSHGRRPQLQDMPPSIEGLFLAWKSGQAACKLQPKGLPADASGPCTMPSVILGAGGNPFSRHQRKAPGIKEKSSKNQSSAKKPATDFKENLSSHDCVAQLDSLTRPGSSADIPERKPLSPLAFRRHAGRSEGPSSFLRCAAPPLCTLKPSDVDELPNNSLTDSTTPFCKAQSASKQPTNNKVFSQHAEIFESSHQSLCHEIEPKNRESCNGDVAADSQERRSPLTGGSVRFSTGNGLHEAADLGMDGVVNVSARGLEQAQAVAVSSRPADLTGSAMVQSSFEVSGQEIPSISKGQRLQLGNGPNQHSDLEQDNVDVALTKRKRTTIPFHSWPGTSRSQRSKLTDSGKPEGGKVSSKASTHAVQKDQLASQEQKTGIQKDPERLTPSGAQKRQHHEETVQAAVADAIDNPLRVSNRSSTTAKRRRGVQCRVETNYADEEEGLEPSPSHSRSDLGSEEVSEDSDKEELDDEPEEGSKSRKKVKKPPSKRRGPGISAADGNKPRAGSQKRKAVNSAPGSGKSSARSAPGRQNFVRIEKKGGHRRFGFKSKTGMKNGPRKKGKGRFFAPKALAQAGDGADVMEGWDRKGQSCFKCGKSGHWAKDCPGIKLAPLDEETQMCSPETKSPNKHPTIPTTSSAPRLNECHDGAQAAHSKEVQQMVEACQQERFSNAALLQVLQTVFKHDNFRGRQLEIIRSVLDGKNLLAVLPTGAGKSLCYQLPALLQEGLTLVVSPLVALMRDQLDHLPPELPAAMLHRGQTRDEAADILQKTKAGELKLLFIAPERLDNFLLLQALADQLPLAMIVVDEAHCVAEWGHNFRSAYFRLGTLIEDKVPCKKILALTATATKATQKSIRDVLGITADTVCEGAMPKNMRLFVQRVQAGLGGSLKPALLKLIGERQRASKSIIVYTTFQAHADEIAGYLYVNGVPATSYHAGKFDKERERIQQEFCQGKLRVIVATVAFGMGLDAAHVTGIVHLTIPRSLEEYVQQVGRAGRSGDEGWAHLFLNDTDFRKLHSLGHSDEVTVSQVSALLRTIFEDNSDFVLLPIGKTVSELDMKEEVMETIISYLEAEENGCIKALPPTGMSVKVSFYHQSAQDLAKESEVTQALLHAAGKPRQGTYSASMAQLCNNLARSPSFVIQALRELAMKEQVRFELSTQKGMVVKVMSTPHETHQLAQELAERHSVACRQQIGRLELAYRTFARACLAAESCQEPAPTTTVPPTIEDSQNPQTACWGPAEQILRQEITAYFEAEQDLDASTCDVGTSSGGAENGSRELALPFRAADPMLGADARALLIQLAKSSFHQDAPHLAQAAARILHGLQSPKFPFKEWCKNAFWGRYTEVAFPIVLRISQRHAADMT